MSNFPYAFRDPWRHRGTEEYRSFQEDTVSRYVREVCRKVKQVDQDQTTMVCVGPRHHSVFEAVASIPELDVFGTDPYWLWPPMGLTKETARDVARQVRRICETRHASSQIWLNCFRIPAGLEEDVYIGGRLLAEVGCDSLYTWGFRGELGTNEECDNPEEAWHSVARLYRELSGR
jgi:hypothetical protein